MSRQSRILARAARLATVLSAKGDATASGVVAGPDHDAAPARRGGVLAGATAGRLAAWTAAGVALLGGTVLLGRGRNAPEAGPASDGGNVRGHVDPEVGHDEHQDWDYGEHGPDTGRGRPSTPASAESREAGHETQDVSTRNIHRIMALFAAVALGATFGMMALIGLWRSDDRASRPRLTAVQVAPIEVPGPHLQVDAYSDLNRERGREIGKLSGWAYTDDSHTEARIPIEDAMTLVAGRPLDTPGLTQADPRGRTRPGPEPDITQDTPLGTGQGSPVPSPRPAAGAR
jgi:hypothetical protein